MKFTRNDKAILDLLRANPGQVVPYEEIQATPPFEIKNNLRVQLQALRKRMKVLDPGHVITTVRGIGLRYDSAHACF